MSPSDDPLFRWNPFTFLKLSYMRSIMQTCPLQTIPYFARIYSLFLKLSYMRSTMQTCPLQTIPCFAGIHSLFLKLSYMRSIMQTCPLQTIPCFAGIHSLFLKLSYMRYSSYKRSLKKVNGFERNKGSSEGDMSA